MKIIKTDLVTAVTASGEDTSYPSSNVQDNFRTNPWKAAAIGAATLTVDVAANSNAVFMSYMNSSTVTVTVKNSTGGTVYGPTAHSIDSDNPNLWVNYTSQSAVAEITLAFTNPVTAAPYCGVVRAGYANSFDNPGYGLQEGLKEFAVWKEYNNGAPYYHKIAIVRTFSGSFLVERDSDFYTFMHTIAKTYGRGPYAVQVTDLSNQDWGVFGWFTSIPTGSHDHYEHSKVSIEIEEAV